MVGSGVASSFEWTPFQHGFVYWGYHNPEHLPPDDGAGKKEWLEGFLQAHADYPDDYDSDHPERCGSAYAALRRMLTDQCDVDALLTLLDRMLAERRGGPESGERCDCD